MSENLHNEIRINSSYVSRLTSNYEIGGKKEESVPHKRSKFLRTTEYMERVQRHLNIGKSDDSHIQPINCRYLKQHKSGSIVIIEEPPAMRTIFVDLDMSRDAESLKAKKLWETYGYKNWFEENVDRPYKFSLALPYTIHMFFITPLNEFNAGKVFFRPKPLLGMSELLFKTPFLNVSSGQGVCYGDKAHRGTKTSLPRQVDHVINTFWTSIFNPDYIDNYRAYENVAGLTDYFTWQYFSQTNPMFVYNADWLVCDRNLGQHIEEYERAFCNSGGEESPFGYLTLRDMFDKVEVSSDKAAVTVSGDKVERNLIYDICNSHQPVPAKEFFLYLGDPLNYSKGRVAFIDSFIGIQGVSHPKYIRLQVDDKLVILSLNERVNKFLLNKATEIRHEACIKVDDIEYRAGDIISMKNAFDQEVYKKIFYIRKTADEKLEIRIGSEYWFADAFEWDKVKKVDLSSPRVNGIDVKKDTVYHYIYRNRLTKAPIQKTIKVKFTDIKVQDNTLTAMFKDTAGAGHNFNINLSAEHLRFRSLYEENEFEVLDTKVYALGRCLMSHFDSSGNPDPYLFRHKKLGIVVSHHTGNSRDTVSLSRVHTDLVQNEGNSFHIETSSGPVHFDIGDKVVVADWLNPLEILKIKTIQSFLMNKETRTIDFVMIDKHGTMSAVPYVSTRNKCVMIGKVRKVVDEIDGIKIGTKIIAKEARVHAFPKKAINVIVAFVIDTGGEPLALCSNGATLWFTDLKDKFELIPMKDKKWKDLQHVPLDPSKLKLQPGDIVNAVRYGRSDTGYLVVKTQTGTGIRFIRLEYYYEYCEYKTPSKSFAGNIIFDCIPNPRMSASQQSERGYVTAFPNFHGGLSIAPNTALNYKLIDETGRF